MTNQHGNRNALWAFLYGNFLIGTGVLLPAGMLNQIAASFSLSASEAGRLMLISGVVVGAGAPLVAGLTSKLDRRTLLCAALAIYVVGHVASAFAGSFLQLEVFRALTIIGAAIFTPQAAATLGLLVPPAERPGAIAFIFIGWSVAAVLGVPMANLLADQMGWHMVYGLMALLSVPGLIWVWFALNPGLYTPPLNLASWKQALTTPLLLLLFAVTLISFTGQFVVFSYIAPLLAKGFAADAKTISLGFAVMGAAGVIGNSFASRIVGRLGVDTVVGGGLALIALGMLIFGLGFGSLPVAVSAFILIGVGNFSSNSLQQSRLAQIAPPLAAATIALNTTFVYLGQAGGTAIGGLLVDEAISAKSAYIALCFSALAVVLSLIAQRMRRKK